MLIALLITGLIQIKPLAVLAAPIACSGDRFSVQTIDGQNIFNEQSCYALTDFDQAMVALNELALTRPNVMIVYYGDNPMTSTVVETTYSKIVAADRAMAYSANVAYANASTMNIFSTPTLTSGTNITYMDDRNPLFYYGTEKINTTVGTTLTPNTLSALISVNGAKGYVKVSLIQLIPLIYVDNKWNYTFDLSGSTRTVQARQAYYTAKESDVNTLSGIKKLRQLTLTVNYVSATNSNYTLGLAPDWLPDGQYYSPDGIVFYTDVDLKNPVTINGQIARYYNYHAYTNLRSKSLYTGEEIDLYTDYYMSENNYNPILSTLVGAGDDFVNAQNIYGMNALMIYAMAAQESGFGRSTYAQNPANLNGTFVKDYTTNTVVPYTVAEYCALYPNNRYYDEFNILHHCNGRYNLFGWGAYDSNPDNAAAFPSIEVGINEHMGINLRRGYMNPDNYVFYGSNIGNKGAGINTRYASDPWWSVGISGIAYRTDRYLGFKDLNSVPIGIRVDQTSTVIYKDPQLTTPYLNSLNRSYTIPARATNTPFIILEGLEVNGQLVYKIQTTNPINENGTVNQVSDPILVPYDFTRSVGYIPASTIGSYLSILVTGVNHGASYNTDKQIYFESGTVTLNGTPITTGTVVSAEGTYQIVAISPTGIRQTLNFTIDKTAPEITINPYSTSLTNQDVPVTASTNEGSLNTTTYTFTDNGTYTFIATDAAGNTSSKTVTITHIDKVAPIITIDPYDSSTIVNHPVTISASTNEGILNATSHTFEVNGSFTFVATDEAGNVSEKVVVINHIVIPVTLIIDTPHQGTLSAAIGAQSVESGQTVYSTDEITLTLLLNPTYRIFRWVLNGIEIKPTSTTYLLTFPAIDTQVGVIVVKEGDLNDDDRLSATDLVKLRRSLAGLDSINEKSAMAADINGDGKVTTTDLVRLRRILAGLE
jgi:beta-N-acetylglucosaminidase